MAHLVPCSGCARHVRASEPRCPFCAAELALAGAPPMPPTQRLGRAARFAFGAAVATFIDVAGCYQSHTVERAEGPDGGAPRDASVSRDAGMDASIAPPYGAPAD